MLILIVLILKYDWFTLYLSICVSNIGFCCDFHIESAFFLPFTIFLSDCWPRKRKTLLVFFLLLLLLLLLLLVVVVVVVVVSSR